MLLICQYLLKYKKIFIFLNYILMNVYIKLHFYYRFINFLIAPAGSAEHSLNLQCVIGAGSAGERSDQALPVTIALPG